ncbi:MAG: bifunctional protein-serine/threonine kinase/phosphatase [Colwellia sp.]|nr:bifunctional protein-serine/threonine kinase/phosphatase [Colwellia sp.]
MNNKNIPLTAKTSAHLRLCFGGFSSSGKKPVNQDAFAALIPSDNELIAKGAIAAIADGVSSASKAAEASQLAVTQFISEYYATPETWSTQKSASKVLNSLNQWLFSQSSIQSSSLNLSSQYSNCESHWLTTFSALILKSTTGYIFHVGDSRISKFRQNQLEAITRDHNRKHGDKHVVLTRAMGADTRLEVDVHKVDLQADDIFILTCDGVHDFLSKKELSDHLANISTPTNEGELEQTSQAIIDHAIAKGSDDNVSCLLVAINEVPNRKLEEIERDLFTRTIPPALKLGDTIDGYTVRKVIHASIRSHLYLVEKSLVDDSPPEVLVLKAPSENFIDDSVYLQGFMREAWVGERINHNKVMKVKSGEINSKFLYHLCEYVEGQTLSEWMHDNPKPSIGQVREIIKQIVSALRAFQRLELVHRDLKPDNIMIDALGQIKLIDYGTVSVASLNENQDTILESVPQGSLNYIAPETLLNMKADNKSDLFSLGVIGYQMLCGELPYKPMKRAEVNFKHYSQWQYRSIKQFRPELPIWLDLSLQQAVQANPKDRYQAFSEFDRDINKPNITAVEEYKTQPILQRNPVLFWQGVSFILAVALILSLTLS